ncbi:MAG: hypothetical protein V4526_01800 [Patescibacteria group bacterium]
MTTTTISAFTALEDAFKSGSKDNVKKALDQFKDVPLTSEERGAVLVRLAMICMKVKTDLNNDIAEQIRESIKTLKFVNKEEKSLDDAQKIADIKKTI